MDDSAAQEEAKHWTDEGALKGLERENHGRLLKLWGWIVPCLMIVFTGLFAASILAWSWHYLTPWGWLKPDQLSKIQSVIFSGSLGAIVSNYFQKKLT